MVKDDERSNIETSKVNPNLGPQGLRGSLGAARRVEVYCSWPIGNSIKVDTLPNGTDRVLVGQTF